MKTFKLPDLGEGLPDAEIVEWMVAEGDEVKVDQPLVSMETAKAVVEVPSPFTGKVVKFYGAKGDIIETGNPLADFEVQDAVADAPQKETIKEDAGTVVGAVEVSDRVVREEARATTGGVKATPAVRAIARKLKVDLSTVAASGAGGVITAADVKKAAEASPSSSTVAAPAAAPAAAAATPAIDGEQIKGTRRTMARTMAQSHAQVVPTTLCDDANLSAWAEGEDITVRLLRAIAAGVETEPRLNAFFDGNALVIDVRDQVDIGIAVDTEDGLFVPVLRDVGSKNAKALRKALDSIREGVSARSIPPEDLTGYSIILSNFGKFAGRYATPIVMPPTVAIMAAGKLRKEVVMLKGKPTEAPVLPLSLTFDHRAATGGEAARFLGAILADLEKAG